MWTRFWARICAALLRTRADREIDEELRFHLDREVARQEAAGASPAEARLTARKRMGNITSHRERARDAWTVRWIDETRQDLRLCLRSLARDRTFLIVSILSLAVGIGSTTSMLAIIAAVDLRSLPVTDAERLVAPLPLTRATDPVCARCPQTVTPALLAEWRTRSTQLDAAVGYAADYEFLEVGGRAHGIELSVVTPDFFRVLGAQALMGRTFQPDDAEIAGPPRVIVLAHKSWQQLFNGDPSIIGKDIRIGRDVGENGSRLATRTVIGVMPPSMDAFFGFAGWVPLSRTATGPSERWLKPIVRVREGASIKQLRSELELLTRNYQQSVREANPGRAVTDAIALKSFRELLLTKTGRVESRFALLAVVSLVLMVAIMNVAALSLARAKARRHETSVRTALGARRTRIVRQILTESIIVAMLGGTAGLFLARWGIAIGSSGLDLAALGIESSVGVTIGLVSFGLATVVGFLSGLLPAIQLSNASANEVLRERGESGRGGTAKRSATAPIIIAQVASALVLLTGAGLLTKELQQHLSKPPGYDPRGLITSMSPVDETAPRERMAQLGHEVTSLGGVQSVAFQLHEKFARLPDFRREVGGERIRSDAIANAAGITPNYFSTLGTRILDGRAFTENDNAGTAPVAIVSQTAAERIWPGERAVGKVLVMTDSAGRQLKRLLIVGVAQTLRMWEEVEPAGALYLPADQLIAIMAESGGFAMWMRFFARVSGNAYALAPKLDSIVATASGGLPGLPYVAVLEDTHATRFRAAEINAALLAGFAAFAMLLAAMGVYGVVANTIGRRQREIGIRIALGASSSSVVRLVVQGALIMVGMGVLVGIVASFVLTGVLRQMLTVTSATDPLVFLGAVVILIVVATISSVVPGVRAARVSATTPLRSDR